MQGFVCVLMVSLFVAGCGSQKRRATRAARRQGCCDSPQNHLEQGVRFLQQANPKAAIESF